MKDLLREDTNSTPTCRGQTLLDLWKFKASCATHFIAMSRTTVHSWSIGATLPRCTHPAGAMFQLVLNVAKNMFLEDFSFQDDAPT